MKRFALCTVTILIALAVAACGRATTPTATPAASADTATPIALQSSQTPQAPQTPEGTSVAAGAAVTATSTVALPTDTPMAPTATPLPPTATPEPVAIVNADPTLNLRSGPGTTFKSLASIPIKAKVKPESRSADNQWIKIKSDEFGEGWVKAEFLDFPANLSAQALPLATEAATAAATPAAAATQKPTAPTPPTKAAATPQALAPTAPAAATPGDSADIDQYIAALLAGTHNRLGNVTSLGPAPAGGKVELVIANDSPFALKVSLGSPARTETRLDACQDCKVYETQGPGSCAPEKPQKTLRIDPGALRLAIESSSPDIAPYVGQWTLQADQKYALCFYILRNPPANQ
jgi:uncharacterized protein YgiM (DUF1202 family)